MLFGVAFGVYNNNSAKFYQRKKRHAHDKSVFVRRKGVNELRTSACAVTAHKLSFQFCNLKFRSRFFRTTVTSHLDCSAGEYRFSRTCTVTKYVTTQQVVCGVMTLRNRPGERETFVACSNNNNNHKLPARFISVKDIVLLLLLFAWVVGLFM
jgi:hypothetical protein